MANTAAPGPVKFDDDKIPAEIPPWTFRNYTLDDSDDEPVTNAPAGAGLILLPLIYELSEFNFVKDIKSITPYLVVVTALLLISKIPTFSLKKIKISSGLTIFLLFGIAIIFVSVIFFQ